MKRLLIVVGIAALAFLAGYVPMYLKLQADRRSAQKAQQDLERHVAETQDRLRAANLQGQLGLLLIDVEQNNFGKAAERSTRFFDDVRTALFACRDEGVRRKLETALQWRDKVTADLAAVRPGAADNVRKLYVEFVGEPAPEAAQPPA